MSPGASLGGYEPKLHHTEAHPFLLRSYGVFGSAKVHAEQWVLEFLLGSGPAVLKERGGSGFIDGVVLRRTDEEDDAEPQATI